MCWHGFVFKSQLLVLGYFVIFKSTCLGHRCKLDVKLPSNDNSGSDGLTQLSAKPSIRYNIKRHPNSHPEAGFLNVINLCTLLPSFLSNNFQRGFSFKIAFTVFPHTNYISTTISPWSNIARAFHFDQSKGCTQFETSIYCRNRATVSADFLVLRPNPNSR